MDKYKVSKFKENSNALMRNQNFYTLSLPVEKMENVISSDEIANLCQYDEIGVFVHAEYGKEYVKFKKYFVVGDFEDGFEHADEALDFLCQVYGEMFEMKYAIIVIKFISEVFEEDEIDALTVYDDIDRHKGHVRFYKDFIRIKSIELKGLRNKFSYAVEEVLERI